jgi:uncharacterized protein YraI
MVRGDKRLNVRPTVFSIAVLWLVFFPGSSTAEVVGTKGKIRGESYVNLRSGPDIDHPSTAILREGEEVTLEREERNWYLVSLKDGRKGYIHRALVEITEKTEAEETARDKVTTQTAAVEERQQPKPLSPQKEERETPQSKPFAIIKVLEGKEWEILWWFGAALGIFITGWICGGNYYLRRDRIRRTKIHF